MELGPGVEVGGWAFAECKSLELVRLPRPERVGPSVFAGCEAIAEMAVDGRTRLAHLFGGHEHVPSALRTVTVTGDGLVANFMRGCASVETLVLSATVAEWGGWAFLGCTGLKKLDVEHGVARIGDWAFADCSALLLLPRTPPDGLSTRLADGHHTCGDRSHAFHRPGARASRASATSDRERLTRLKPAG